MKCDDRFKYLVGGYFGVKAMESYSRRLFILKEIEEYIRKYVRYSEEKLDYKEIASSVEKNTSLKEKLQDSLLVLHEMDGPIELILMIKLRVKELKYSDK